VVLFSCDGPGDFAKSLGFFTSKIKRLEVTGGTSFRPVARRARPKT
jgi:hypothetical protein